MHLLRPLALAILLAAQPAAGLEPPPVALVHVRANTGAAAGGHAALRVGDLAYHWEVHADGWLHLARDPWKAFALRYGTLENRPMHRVELALAPDDRSRLETLLLRLWGHQSRELSELEALSLRRSWLEHVVNGAAPPTLPGVGFFDPSPGEDPTGRTLRQHVSNALGKDELERALAHAERKIATASATLPSAAGDEAARGLRDALLERAALDALLHAHGLAAGATVSPVRWRSEAPLCEQERVRLERFAADLESAIVRLLQSPRPDRGRPLLLAMARLHALRQSLATGQLVLLDAVPGDETVLRGEELLRHRDLLQRLARAADRDWRQARAAILGGAIDEPRQAALEEAATGLSEMHAALAGRPLRARSLGRLIPARPGRVAPASRRADPTALEALAQARELEARRRVELAERFTYDLVLHNCATEIDSLLSGGGPRGPASFIPSLLARGVEAKQGGGAEMLPSYRQRRVAEMAAEEGGLRVALRESNTLSSRAYEGSVRDHPFLFFADGSPWLRPLQGTANLGYGLGHAVAGLASAPFDRGRRVRDGLAGAFYSLPELVGFNIRKGRYDLLPVDDAFQGR